MKRFVVLFVCTGNLCRSPTAEGIMKDLILDEVALHRTVLPVDVLSAGIHATEGQPASRHAVEAAAEHGINLGFHRSRQLTANMARTADLILTMEKMHTDFITYHWPDVGCAHELKRYGRDHLTDTDDTDIPDPIGFGIEVYREVFGELREEVVRVSRVLFPLIKERQSTL